MQKTVFLLTPPFTQLNTPYPATTYLKGFLNTKKIHSFQADLGIDVTLKIFSREGLQKVFDTASLSSVPISENCNRILAFREEYLHSIDPLIRFLQGANPTLANQIVLRGFLPEASRFSQLDDLTWAFGSMGIYDKAKHLATMYLEDISDLIKEFIDPHFGFSRYAERLGRSANSFNELYALLNDEPTFTDKFLHEALEKYMRELNPGLVAISVPFPGNLYSAFRCAKWLKEHRPEIKIVMGGGYPNTELRSLTDPRVFEFFDYITLDDGEAPLLALIEHINELRPSTGLKRTFLLQNGKVEFVNDPTVPDYKQGDVGTPDYSDLPIRKYISAIEVVNPMHRLWSDGRWNKLTMAHGCYWAKCTFCDISLPYIQSYEPVAASLLCDRIEELIAQTGENGFHFVDEAAPPALMRALAMEILRRKLVVTWWTNIRFEKSFTRDLCLLLKAAGCIAVSGGLEVASDRLLKLIDKGITVAQVANVTKHFTDAGIMVHAYLMYGFPTQTVQETVDSLEMVRQLFLNGTLQSAFWHLFTMTAHSPIGIDPGRFKVQRKTQLSGSFANNDLDHEDPDGADHELYGFGLKKSLYNFMHSIGLNDSLQKWFEFPIPKTTVNPDYIRNALAGSESLFYRPEAKVVWFGKAGAVEFYTQSKKGNSREMVSIYFHTIQNAVQLSFARSQGEWLLSVLPLLHINNLKSMTLAELKSLYENAGLEDFELFWDNKPMNTMHKYGLLKF